MAEQKASVSLTADDLRAILADVAKNNREDLIAVLAEVRKPKDKTPTELIQEAQDEQMRQERADLEQATQAGRRAWQKRCTHRHQNMSAAIAQVQGFAPYANTDFVICVKCQAKIKPAAGPFDEPEDYIYDERLYYDLIGALPQTTF